MGGIILRKVPAKEKCREQKKGDVSSPYARPQGNGRAELRLRGIYVTSRTRDRRRHWLPSRYRITPANDGWRPLSGEGGKPYAARLYCTGVPMRRKMLTTTVSSRL